jgi:hypothetical protein
VAFYFSATEAVVCRSRSKDNVATNASITWPAKVLCLEWEHQGAASVEKQIKTWP